MPEGLIATLAEWSIWGYVTDKDPRPLCRAVGLAEVTPTKPGGGVIHTSTILSAKKVGGDWTIHTASGSKYIFNGPPSIDVNQDLLETLSVSPWTLSELDAKFPVSKPD